MRRRGHRRNQQALNGPRICQPERAIDPSKIRHGPYGADVVGSIDKDEVKLVAVGVGYRQILFAVLLPKSTVTCDGVVTGIQIKARRGDIAL